jgi:hypothetical protein
MQLISAWQEENYKKKRHILTEEKLNEIGAHLGASRKKATVPISSLSVTCQNLLHM